MKGLKLATSDFHFLSHDDVDEYVEWLTVTDAHPELAKFICELPAGAHASFKLCEDSQILLSAASGTLNITLPIYFCSSEEINSLLGYLDHGGALSLTKNVWTARKYNAWLQFESGCLEAVVYPAVCPKCECLMSCSSEHYSKRKDNWDRVRCTNSGCGNVMAKDSFVAAFKRKNEKKRMQELASVISEHTCDVVMGTDYSQVPEGIRIGWPRAAESGCRECGGRVEVWRTLQSERLVSLICSCERCFGSVSTSFSMRVISELPTIRATQDEDEGLVI